MCICTRLHLLMHRKLAEDIACIVCAVPLFATGTQGWEP